MTTTAKHFICYSLLLIALLFTFGLYHTTDLRLAAETQKVADKTTAINRILANSQEAIKARERQVIVAQTELEVEKSNARSLQQDTALLETLLQALDGLPQAKTPPLRVQNCKSTP